MSNSFDDSPSRMDILKLAEVSVTVQPLPSTFEDTSAIEEFPELPLEFSPIKLPPPPSRPQTPEEDPNDTKFGTSAKPILYLDNDDRKRDTLIHIGGFGRLTDRENLKPCQLPTPFSPGFPPPSNNHYHLTTNGHLAEDPNERGSYFQVADLYSLLEPYRLAQNNALRKRKSTSQLSITTGFELPYASKVIDIPMNDIKTPNSFTCNSNLLDPKALDAQNITSTVCPNDFCRKCKQFHISPGDPDTLPDRDTCGSYIPDWHHPPNLEQPWASFIELYSELLYVVDEYFGFDTSTGNKNFYMDMEYHPEHPKWRETTYPIGGGIWLCRSANGAPQAERTCDRCHMVMVDPTILEDPIGKKLVIEWVHYMLRYLGLSDVEVARAIVHKMGNVKIGELVHDTFTPAWKSEHFAGFEEHYEGTAQVGAYNSM